MLQEFSIQSPPDPESLNTELKTAREVLAGFQMKIKEKKLPVMVIFEGWDAAGKGSVISKIIRNIDPRFFQVTTMPRPTEEE